MTSPATGSGRSIPGFDLLAALARDRVAPRALRRPPGRRRPHDRPRRLDDFRAAFERHAERVLTPDLLEPGERVDAIVSGAELGLPTGRGAGAARAVRDREPDPAAAGPRRALHRPAADGRGQARALLRRLRRRSARGRSRSGAAAGCAAIDTPRDATFKLERNAYNGAVEPRLVLRHEQPCAPPPIEVLGEPGDYLATVLERARASARRRLEPCRPRAVAAPAGAARDRPPRREPAGRARRCGRRRRTGAGGVRRRPAAARRPSSDAAAASRSRAIEALEREPSSPREFAQLVVLDPPAGAVAERRPRVHPPGVGRT